MPKVEKVNIKMYKFTEIRCKNCGNIFLKDNGHYKENLKLGHNFYCSKRCELEHKTRGRKILKCENCGKEFMRTPHAFSPHNYCSQSCAAIINNRICLKGHAKIQPKMKNCAECGKEYRKSTRNKKYCSRACSSNARQYSADKLLEIIQTVAKNLGRTPARREFWGGIDKACVRIFGSWNGAISAAQLIPNRSHDNRMYKRAKARAMDGHLCDSISELLVDNWLYKNNISHEKDIRYPETHHKADWRILIGNQKIFVEYFGLANDSPRYDRTVKEKEALCDKNKISLISIFPYDLYPKISLENNLKEKFKNFLII